MDKFPTPTLDTIKRLKQNGGWKAKDGESLSPTSLDWKMTAFLLLGTLELIGTQVVESIKVQKEIRDLLKPKDIAQPEQVVELPSKEEPPVVIKKTVVKTKKSGRY